jgi:hypothetical protein
MSLLVIFLVKVRRVNLIIQAVKSDSESDNGIGEENSDEASNPTQSFLKIMVPVWLEHYASIGKMCPLQ